jgi:nucleotide-binding universal stress UspA family protein
MNQALQAVPFVRSIFHPSDFSQASQLAFVHALAIALLRKTSLVIMHASRVPVVEDWARFPRVRKTLEQWQLLAPGSPRGAVAEQLAIHVTKLNARCNPVQASVDYIEAQRPDLVVLATHGRQGLPRWLKPSVAQAIARRTTAMTLFVPQGCRGIVSVGGDVRLRRILLPVDHQPNAQEAMIRAVRAATTGTNRWARCLSSTSRSTCATAARAAWSTASATPASCSTWPCVSPTRSATCTPGASSVPSRTSSAGPTWTRCTPCSRTVDG